ncbi:MAG: pilus assembly protein PilV [Burkholderiales bacterium]
MLEALIALLIFSLGVLGLVGLQASLARATSSSKYRAEASFLANELIGTMWTDAPNLASYKTCSTHAPCNRWQTRVNALLPSGTPSLSVCTNSDTSAECSDDLGYQTVGRVRITITWTVPNEASHTFTTITTINPN